MQEEKQEKKEPVSIPVVPEQQQNKEDIKPTREQVSKFLESVEQQDTTTIIIPLYGYWRNQSIEQLTAQTLEIMLSRIKSLKHKIYIMFVVESGNVSDEILDVIAGYTKFGNVMGISVEAYSTYSEFFQEGVELALEKTKSRFIIFANPWIILQSTSIDNLIDRANKGDVFGVSGVDVKSIINPNDFDTFKPLIPKEIRALNLDLFCLPRYAAESIKIDEGYKTHYFLAVDIWQSIYTKGSEVISTERVPYYSFDLDWTLLELPEDFQHDKDYFISKWRFDPSVKYQ